MTPEPKLPPDYLAAKRKLLKENYDRIAQIEYDYQRARADQIRSFQMELAHLRRSFYVDEDDDDASNPQG